MRIADDHDGQENGSPKVEQSQVLEITSIALGAVAGTGVTYGVISLDKKERAIKQELKLETAQEDRPLEQFLVDCSVITTAFAVCGIVGVVAQQAFPPV